MPRFGDVGRLCGNLYSQPRLGYWREWIGVVTKASLQETLSQELGVQEITLLSMSLREGLSVAGVASR